MPDDLRLTDPPTRLDKALEEMKEMFRANNEKTDTLRSQFTSLKADAATIDSVRKVQDQMREFVEAQNAKQTSATMDTVEAKLGQIRQGIMSDTERLLNNMFEKWKVQERERLTPIIDELMTAREEKAQLERDKMVQQWRNRVALGTAVLLFLVSIWQFARPADQNPRDYVRPIERLDDVTR